MVISREIDAADGDCAISRMTMRFGDSPFAGGEVGESRIALSEAGAARLVRGETEEPTTGSAAMIKRCASGSMLRSATVDVLISTGTTDLYPKG